MLIICTKNFNEQIQQEPILSATIITKIIEEINST
jgi:hypothetical protein